MLENAKNLISLFIECAIFNELNNNGIWIEYENSENTIDVFNKYNLVTDIKKALKISHLNETIDNVDNDLLYEIYVDLMYNVECGSGIHFFWTKEEAEDYDL